MRTARRRAALDFAKTIKTNKVFFIHHKYKERRSGTNIALVIELEKFMMGLCDMAAMAADRF